MDATIRVNWEKSGDIGTVFWSDGREGNTRNCVDISLERLASYMPSQNENRTYLYLGRSVPRIRLTNGSGMNREVHVPFCERLA